MGAFSLFLTVVQFVSALILIVLVMLQTTKSEGLTGTIGGKASATFKGKPGLDEKLSQLTKWSAVGFAVTSALLYWISIKAGA
ncbi:MAG: preprotein translocase subunit SecG [Armatimonadetes bacterium]|nr:preprotein translocase subunit SecG [Armatimonadota bacterium]